MVEYLGTGKLLNIVEEHPYIGKSFLKKEKEVGTMSLIIPDNIL